MRITTGPYIESQIAARRHRDADASSAGVHRIFQLKTTTLRLLITSSDQRDVTTRRRHRRIDKNLTNSVGRPRSRVRRVGFKVNTAATRRYARRNVYGAARLRNKIGARDGQVLSRRDSDVDASLQHDIQRSHGGGHIAIQYD